MRSQRFDRREFMAAAGIVFAALLDSRQAQAMHETDAIYASCFETRDGSHGFALVNERGDILTKHRLTGRGHGFTTSAASGWSVAFARAPGNFAYAFKADGTEKPVAFSAPTGRHFFGHGAFSANGSILYATENDFEAGRGVIGLYDVSDHFARIGEFASAGIGPHEMLASPDGSGLWVANGGILTHPSSGKAKLNLDTMQSNVVLLSQKDGTIMQQWDTPAGYQRLSLRHMALVRDGSVWIGAQYEGSAMDGAPLVARIAKDEPVRFVDLPDAARVSLKDYVGSVAASGDGSMVAFTSPIGHGLVLIDAQSGSVRRAESLERVCGVAGTSEGILVSTETGLMGPVRHDVLWDNHLTQL